MVIDGGGSKAKNKEDAVPYCDPYQYSKVPKSNLPRFNGEEVMGWLLQCSCYFMIHPIAAENRVPHMSPYLEGKG